MLELLAFAIALIIAIDVHEFAHAFTADRLGDPTPVNFNLAANAAKQQERQKALEAARLAALPPPEAVLTDDGLEGDGDGDGLDSGPVTAGIVMLTDLTRRM